MRKTYLRIFIFGLISAILMIGLKISEYYFFSSRLTLDIYLGIIALLFLLIGAGIGHATVRDNGRKIVLSHRESMRHEKAYSDLTTREVEVLKLIAEGYSNKQIAGALFISLNTVKTHTKNIYSKLDASRRTQAVARAKKLKILR